MALRKRSKRRLTNALQNYYDGQRARLLEDLQAAWINRERAGVHNLRVDIKRLRAFVHLVERIAPSIDVPGAFRPIRCLFRAASGLRDIHVQLGLLAGEAASAALAERLNEWYNELKAREIKARGIFEAEAGNFRPSALAVLKNRVDCSLKGIPEGMGTMRAEQSLQTLFGRLQELASMNRLGDQEIHQIRVFSKEARYTLEIIGQTGERPGARAGLDETLKSVHQALGRWNDRRVAFDRLTDFLQRAAFEPLRNPDEYGTYLSLLHQEMQAALQEFRATWEYLVADFKSGPPPNPAPPARPRRPLAGSQR